ncbi:phage tail protein [Paracoccus sp. 22332]|uniref:phage tail protein n=1 Tax=Paracoccus sp. 22332 TaxID=3453913 RepID=UPI003F87ABF0
MLMMIGPVQFKVAPFNATEYARTHTASHVAKQVLGAAPPLEFTGEGEESWSIRAILFPEKFGGEGTLNILSLMRRSGQPQYMMRGDGGLMGWVVIDSVSERSSYLDPGGVGRVIEVDIALRRTSAPLAGAFFSSLTQVFNSIF